MGIQRRLSFHGLLRESGDSRSAGILPRRHPDGCLSRSKDICSGLLSHVCHGALYPSFTPNLSALLRHLGNDFLADPETEAKQVS